MLTELVPVTFVQLFSQFDAEGEGFADVETFLEVGYIYLCQVLLVIKVLVYSNILYFIAIFKIVILPWASKI